MRALPLLFVTQLLLTSAFAQTTGVVGINDYTINGVGSGSTSCSAMCYPNGGVTLNLDVSAPAGSVALLLFNFCPCSPCSLAGPSNTCLPAIPATACGGSNQSLDLDMSSACGIAFTLPVTLTTAGTLSVALPIPTIPGVPCASLTLSTQAVVIDPCGLGIFAAPGPFVLSQAYTLQF
ncbi:MAG: hypothetical protein JNM25_13860 [Planctomycetes bacterium]|nr:hypothetical protein [Planctomycetota bacterium]